MFRSPIKIHHKEIAYLGANVRERGEVLGEDLVILGDFAVLGRARTGDRDRCWHVIPFVGCHRMSSADSHPFRRCLYAVDTAPALPKETHQGPLAGSGRGIPIINGLAAMTWIDQDEEGKTIHVVLTRTDGDLTPHDRKLLNPRCDP